MVDLVKADLKDVEKVLNIQKECFKEYLEKYQDHQVNPCNEDMERLRSRLGSEEWDIYFIKYNDEIVGLIKVNHYDVDTYKINDFGVLPGFRDLHIGTSVFGCVKESYSNGKVWILSTILQEERCIHFYEKLGFVRTTDTEPKVINDKMTIVGYKLVIK